MNTKIKLNELVTEGLQTRSELSPETVGEYAEAMQEGATFPPIVTFGPYLADGFHRVAAAQEIGLAELDADCREGTREDALRYALAANSAHGLRRTNADKRRALELAWTNRQALFGKDPSVRELAAITAVSVFLSQSFINETRVLENNTSSAEETSEAAAAAGAKAMLREGKDRFGEPIPEKILPAFRSAPLRKLMRTARSVRSSIAEHVDAMDLSFAALPQQVLINLDNAVNQMRFAEPYCVCRACGGDGCYRCNNRGFQTILQYKEMPREYRVK